MSWLLNSMERKVAEIFSFYESCFHLWEAVKEMYGNQNNSARVFQLKKDIASLQQEGKPFIQLLGSMKSMWNELEANHATSSTDGPSNFTSNHVSLINEFAAYLQKKNGGDESKGVTNSRNENSIALLGKFAGFLAESDKFSHEDIPGVLTAAYLINRLPSRVLDFKSPYEVMKGKKINLSHLRVFGCTCFVHIQSSHRDKLDPRAVKCIFMGYSSSQKGYKCYNHNSKKLIVTRDVKFDETTTFYSKSPESSSHGEHFLDLFPFPNPAANNDSFSPMSTNIDMPLTETESVVPSAADEDSKVTHHQHEDQSTIEAVAPTPL
ncbi:unnamed protein product [Prunus brigantina]